MPKILSCGCCGGHEMAPRGRVAQQTFSAQLIDDGMVGCADFCNTSRMSEGRQSQVVLLDDRRLDILIKPKLYAGELLDMVSSHFSLKEKEYFGLAYVDETGHYCWLQLDRRVLEHEFPKKTAQSTLILYFRIKYFVESITHLRDSATVVAFYLQTRSLVYKGTIEVCSDKAFQLAALVLQDVHGDYVSDETAKQHLKKLPVIPTSTLLEHPSLTVCEERVIEEYKSVQGQLRGTAIVNYMQIVESLPTYGVHYFEVKDKSCIPWWLGISFKGICQYDQTDRKVPRKVFLWKQLENLYFRDRKFSIEVHDPKRITANRRTFGSGNISVHVWFAFTPSLTKCIWSMAIAQHQFYLDRKHNRSSVLVSRSLAEIAADLSQSVHSLSTDTPPLSRTASSLSLPALKIDSGFCEEAKFETIEMFVTLKARKEVLEDVLKRKTEELKKLCLQEGELTGALPPEMPLTPGEQIPIIEKKVGKVFSLKEKLLWKKRSEEDEELSKLELEYEIQKKVTSSACKLANDPSSKKTVRRQRKISHQKAQSKLKDIEEKLNTLKKKIESSKREHLRQYSDDEPSEDNMSHSTDDNDPLSRDTGINLLDLNIALLSQGGEIEDANNVINRTVKTMSSSAYSITPLIHPSSSNSAPPSPSKPRHVFASQQNWIRPISPSSVLEGQGYTPSSVYQTRTSYRSQQYPTLPMRSPSSYSSGTMEYSENNADFAICDRNGQIPPLMTPYQNRFESTLDIEGSNLYSVQTQRTSQAFDSQDDSLASVLHHPQDLGLISRHNSLDRSRRHSYQRYRRYLENAFHHAEMARPHSVQASTSYDERLSHNRIITQAEVHPYQLAQPQPVPTVSLAYNVHHPHHFHHRRHTHLELDPYERTSNLHGNSRGNEESLSGRHNVSTSKSETSYSSCSLPTNNEPYLNFKANSPFIGNDNKAQRLRDIQRHRVLPTNEGLRDIQRHCVPPTNEGLRDIQKHRVPSANENIYTTSLDFSSGLPSKCTTSQSASKETLNCTIDACPVPHESHAENFKKSSNRTKTWAESSLDELVTESKLRGSENELDGACVMVKRPKDFGKVESHQYLKTLTENTAVSEPVTSPCEELSPLNQSNVEISVVSYGHFQPYWEETKPYETSDFYKYSTKHRKQHQVACQNLHAKITAWKCQNSTLYPNATPKVMSPVLERSHTASPIYNPQEKVISNPAIRKAESSYGDIPSLDRMRTEAQLPPKISSSKYNFPEDKSVSITPVADAFQDEMLEWYLKQEKIKKTTLV